MSDKTDPVAILLERREALEADLKASQNKAASYVIQAKTANDESVKYTVQIAAISNALVKLGYVEPGKEAHAP